MFCQTLVDFTDKDQSKAKQAFKDVEASMNKVQGMNEEQISQAPSITANGLSSKVENLIIKSEGLKSTNSVDVR
jgi:hypothetical protein